MPAPTSKLRTLPHTGPRVPFRREAEEPCPRFTWRAALFGTCGHGFRLSRPRLFCLLVSLYEPRVRQGDNSLPVSALLLQRPPQIKVSRVSASRNRLKHFPLTGCPAAGSPILEDSTSHSRPASSDSMVRNVPQSRSAGNTIKYIPLTDITAKEVVYATNYSLDPLGHRYLYSSRF